MALRDGDIELDEFYWVIVDRKSRVYPDADPELIVARPSLIAGRISWDECGSDEGIGHLGHGVIEIVEQVKRPRTT